MFKKTISFLSDNWVGVIIIMVIALFLFWSIGYFCNAIYSTKFELSSCWAGVVAVCGTGVLGLGKYYTDSKHNSEQGKAPI